MTITLTDREFATLLDALAAYTDRRRKDGGFGVVSIARAEHFNDHEPLHGRAVDELYWRLKGQHGGA